MARSPLRRSEITEASFENVRPDGSGFVFELHRSNTNQSGRRDPKNFKPIQGAAAAALQAWIDELLRFRITEGKLFRRVWHDVMGMQTTQEFDTAIARLSSRTPQSLATFIVSLVHDDGPIGEHVRSFIVGDDLAETVASLKTRIDALRDERRRYYRHRDGVQVGECFKYVR